MPENPNLPWQLCSKDFRFLKVKAQSKQPEGKWNEIVNHLSFNDKSLAQWLKDGGNVGMLGGYGNIAIVDCDKKELEEALRRNLPPTMTEKTAKGIHFFFIVDGPEFFWSLDLGDEHFGEVRADRGHQTVIAPSVHPETKQQYLVVDDLPIAEIEREKLLQTIMPFTEKRQIPWQAVQAQNYGNKKYPLETVLKEKLDSMKRLGNGEYQGKHPYHDSTTGQNFCANLEKDLWYCFRHGFGSNALHLIAQEHNLVKCGEPLRGSEFLKAVELAYTEYRMDVSEFRPDTRNEQIVTEADFFKPFEAYGIPEDVQWLVPNYIPNKGVTIIAGLPGCGKSFLTEEIMSAILNCRKVFGEIDVHLPAQGRPVVLLDLENDHFTMYTRFTRLGGVPEEKLWVYNMEMPFDFLNPDNAKIMKDIVDKTHPALIVFDTLRRTYSGDENDSKEINKLYRDTLSPISKKYPCIVVAHARKPNKATQTDKLSEIRGTGDIVGLASCVLFVEQETDKSFTITCEKMRSDKKPKTINVELLKDYEDTPQERWYFHMTKNVKVSFKEEERATTELMNWIVHNKKNGDILTTSEIAAALEEKGITSNFTHKAIGLLRGKALTNVKRGQWKVDIDEPSLAKVEPQLDEPVEEFSEEEREEQLAEDNSEKVRGWLREKKLPADIIMPLDFETMVSDLGLSRATVFRIVKKLVSENVLESQQRGRYKYNGD